MKLKLFENRSSLDVVNVIAGLGLAFSPWYLGFVAESQAAWNAWLVGAAITAIAGVAMFAFHEYEEWVNLALGLWAVVAPWILGFSAITQAMIVHIVAGIVVAAIAASNLWFTPNKPLSTA